MLKQDSIEKIFSTARAKGLYCGELYLENTVTESIQFLGKQHKTLISEASGANLSCESPTGVHLFSVSDVAPEAIMEALGSPDETSVQSKTELPPVQSGSFKRERLISLARKLESLSPQFSFDYIQTRRNFAIVNSEGSITQSLDENVQFLYRVQKDSNQYRKSDFQTSIDAFWKNSFNEQDLLNISKERMDTYSLWPLPMGEVPVLLSHHCLSKILFHILKSFEADNLIIQQSFLSFLEESLPLSFSLVESPNKSTMDQEGEFTKTLSLFAAGEFKEFATNKRIAASLSLPKSGHGRRMNYKHAPQISLFSSRLVPNENLWMNLSGLQRAIFVEDLEILEYDPKSTASKIQVPHSKLVHHGDFGEKLVSWEWEISLLEILKNLKQFSKDSVLHGFGNRKGKSTLPIEITCPDALIEGLPLPGSVPQEYYWE